MKSLFSVLTWTLLFFILGFYINTEITKFTQSYQNKISIVETYIISEDWEEASNQLESLTKSWHEEKNIWYKLLNHEYFDSISLNLNLLESAITVKSKSMSFEQIEIIKMSLDNIVESEKCDWNHII